MPRKLRSNQPFHGPEIESDQIPLAKKVWGLDWNELLPVSLTSEVSVHYSDYQRAQEFANKHFKSIYLEAGEGRFSDENEDPRISVFRQNYYEQIGDFFLLQTKDQPVALAVGTVLDWSSYNFRNMSVIPEYQNHGLYVKFFELLCAALRKHNVKRVEGDVAPSNHHHIHLFNKLGYTATAISLDDRWGARIHITKYLTDEDEARFGTLFCASYKSDAEHDRQFKQRKLKAQKR